MIVDYKGKTVVITGASGAIGSSMCEYFAKNGANVVVGARNELKAKPVIDKISLAGGKAVFFPLDATDKVQLKKTAEEIEKTFGAIHVLINNAGVNVGPEDRQNINNFNDDKWDWIINTDLNGVYNCSKAFLPYIIKAGGGNILNISSVVGMVPFRKQCAFTAAKAAVINLTKAMAIELADEKVRVNCICPGSIMMEGTKALFYNDPKKAEAMMVNIPQHHAGEPEDIANAALYVCSDKDAAYLTGAIIPVDGGWTSGFARDF